MAQENTSGKIYNVSLDCFSEQQKFWGNKNATGFPGHFKFWKDQKEAACTTILAFLNKSNLSFYSLKQME